MAEDFEKAVEKMIFDENMKEFAAKIGIVCNLEVGGKLSPEEAYSRIKELYKELKRSKKGLLDES